MSCQIDRMSESDEISQEDLEAASKAYDILVAEGWEGWVRRQKEAVEWLRSRPGIREAVRRSIEELKILEDEEMKTDREIGEMDDMEAVIRSHGDFAYGSEKVEDVAQEWKDYGFSANEADAWLRAGCFRASAARDLADLGIAPGQVSQDTDKGLGGYVASIGYKYTNNDLTIEQVQEIVEQVQEIERK